MKRKKKSQKRLVIKAEQGEISDSHEVSPSDWHSSLLHSLRVQLGKERKRHSGEDFNICNYGEGGCPNLEQTLNFHRRICLPNFGQANRRAADRPRKPVSVQVKGDLLLRWAEEKTGRFPRAAGNQTDCEPDLAGSLHQDAHRDQNCTVILQIGRS